MTDIKEQGDRMEEACGVFGIYAQDSDIHASEAAYYGLFALQHRGQESAGIAVADGKTNRHYRNHNHNYYNRHYNRHRSNT